MKGRFMTRFILLAGLVFIALGAKAQTIERPDDIPDSFDGIIQSAAPRCGSEGAARFDKGGFTAPYDLNDDGVNDYIVDSSYFRCFPESSLIYGGTAGTHYWFFISQDDGTFEEAMHLAAHNMQIVYFGEKPTFVFAHHGGSCGYSGATGCVSAMFWSNFENKFIGKGY